MQSFLCEIQKVRHRHDLLLILGTVAVLVLWMFYSVHGLKPEEFSVFYTGLFYLLPLVNTIVLPIAMAVLASRLWDVENQGNTAKLLFTLQTPQSLYAAKLALGFCEVAAIAALELAAVPVLGRLFGATQPLSPARMAWQFFSTLLASLMLFCLELILSMRFQNQVSALAVGLGGGIVGLFSAFFPGVYSVWLPWSYYMQQLAVAMDWNPDTRVIHYILQPFPWWAALVLVAATGLLAFAGRRMVCGKEV